jgi:hypothetical protein
MMTATEKTVIFLVHLDDGLGTAGPFIAQWDTEDGSSSRIDLGVNGIGVILGTDTPCHLGARFRATAVDMLGDYVGEVSCETV